MTTPSNLVTKDLPSSDIHCVTLAVHSSFTGILRYFSEDSKFQFGGSFGLSLEGDCGEVEITVILEWSPD